MATVILFHHIQGLTPGVKAFAEALRGDGHVVHTPDSFEGRTFASIEEGQAYLGEIGFGTAATRAVAAAEDLPADAVYGGFSLGVMPAMRLIETRPGARGGLLYHGFVDPAEFGAWPAGVPAQIHAMDADPFFVDEGDIVPARAFVEATEGAELFLYPGAEHLFTDGSLAAYDAAATALVLERSREFLARL